MELVERLRLERIEVKLDEVIKKIDKHEERHFSVLKAVLVAVGTSLVSIFVAIFK